MYKLFQELPIIDKGKIILPEYIYVRGFYLKELARVRDYYQSRRQTAPNQHLVVQLLNMLNVSFKRDIQNYVDVASDAAYRLSSVLRITSSTNHGAVFTPGQFYGNQTTEIVIITDEEFDIEHAYQNWQALEPIRVLRHPFTDLNMALADGDYEGSSERGLAVISINIGMLALQFRRWCQSHGMENSAGAASHFVFQYPIINMVNSHLDIAMFNRLAAIYNDRAVGEFKKCHPFFIQNYTDRIDQVLNKQIRIQELQKMDWEQMMMSIGLITKDTLFEAMILPDVVHTRQVNWALVVARIPLFRFLVKLNNDTDNPRNTQFTTVLKNELRAIRTDRTLYQAMPMDLAQEIESVLYGEIETQL